MTGSDANVYPPMSDFLAEQNIKVYEGFFAANLDERPDLVIVGNVIRRENPEALALAELKIPYLSFPQALSHFFIQEKTSLVVCGTHGKTTTSSLLATLLHGAGLAPSFMIGGLVQAFGRNFNVAGGDYFVAEGDEYDTAFFDKGPKFLHYRPNIAILTSIEFDHADIYTDLEAVKVSFRKLVAAMPPDGTLIAYMDDPVVREIVQPAQCSVVGYGQGEDCAWQLAECTVQPGQTRFVVKKYGRPFGEFANVLPGKHNALNSLSVIAALDQVGVGAETIRHGLVGFQGIRRRQEVRGVVNDITVIDDFAHHPTAVRETLGALKEAYSGKRLVAVFEPRTNSSRRNVFQKTYVHSFDGADVVVIREPIPLDNVPEAERFSSSMLVSDLKELGKEAHFFPDTDSILSFLKKNACPQDVLAILSNGGFDNIHERLLELLAGRG